MSLGKQYDFNIYSIWLISIALLLVTPLYYSMGYVLIFDSLLVVALCLLLRKVKLNSSECIIFGLMLVFYLIYVVNMVASNAMLNVKNSLVMFCTIIASYLLSKYEPTYRDYRLFDVLCFLIQLYVIFYSLYYAKTGIFPFDWNYVDFSMFAIFAFTLGMKRGYCCTSAILAIIASAVLPARTWFLFLALFILFYFLKGFVAQVLQCKLFGKTILIILYLFIAITLLACFWVDVLSQYFAVIEGHGAAFDQANMERFTTMKMANEIMIKENFFFKGLDMISLYEPYLDKYDILMPNVGPHNSFHGILLYYSICFGGIYLLVLSRIVDHVTCKEMIPYIYPYLICCCILHDNLTGFRFFLFAIVLLVPFKGKTGRRIVWR